MEVFFLIFPLSFVIPSSIRVWYFNHFWNPFHCRQSPCLDSRILTWFPFKFHVVTFPCLPCLLRSTNLCGSVIHIESFSSSSFKVLIWIFVTIMKIYIENCLKPSSFNNHLTLVLISTWLLPQQSGIGHTIHCHVFTGLVSLINEFLHIFQQILTSWPSSWYLKWPTSFEDIV